MFKNLSLNRKLIAIQSISLLLLMMVMSFSYFQLADLSGRNKQSILNANDTTAVMIRMDNMNLAVIREAKAAKDVWLRGADPDEKDKFQGEFSDQVDNFLVNQSEAEKMLQILVVKDPSVAVFLEGIVKIAAEHKNVSNKFLAQIKVHDNAKDSDERVKGIEKSLFRQIYDLRSKFVKAEEKKGVDVVLEIDREFILHRNIFAVVALIAIVLLAVISVLFARSISRQLGGDPEEVLNVVKAMASGNLLMHSNKRLTPNSLLAHAYSMQSSMRDMIFKVKEQSISMGEMAGALASSAQQISVNTNNESEAVSSMAASIEQLSVSTASISEQGSNAKGISFNSRKKAEDGSKVINKTVSDLLSVAQKIEGASGEVSCLGDDALRIREVVNVIKEIADQTNLLALNAAIEAARAGEQGRGFAVVADEVRKLAARAAKATVEINGMSSKIGDVAGRALDSMKSVIATTQESVKDAELAQASNSNIQQGFTDVVNVINDIAVSLAEQNSAATSLAQNTERVASMSDENSNAVKQLLEFAKHLQRQAEEVRVSVEVFSV